MRVATGPSLIEEGEMTDRRKTDRRKKDADWALNINADGTYPGGDARLAVLMDIRDELKEAKDVYRTVAKGLLTTYNTITLTP